MKFNTDKIVWTEAMKNFAQEQANRKLARIVEDPSAVEFKLSKVNKEVKVCVAIDGYRAQSINEDFYIAVSEALGKIKQTIVKTVKKINSRDNKYLVQEEDVVEDFISKEKIFILEPETIDVAIERFEKTDYNFYVFKDFEYENNISVLYKRFDGKYGIIRCK